MSRQFTSIVSLALLSAACWAFPTLVSAQGNGHDRPFSGHASGSIVGQIPPNGLSLSYTGLATHLGQFSRNETLFVNGDGSVTGQLVFFAANGDELRALISGQFTSANSVIGQYQFAGGTGRFASATGHAGFSAVTADGIHVDVVFEGRIRY